ncbi:lmo0937 family membrane protein [Novosphingobium decolorationis]|uniref:Lmo0937 family membrane protein n=1 Tax=Novosphingobium decolorationis TaxID=2698673 RepID=A0ABX8E649_9SPHN|nr:lmo0937 family membrane protein [Novosphingobium decolorationis]MED5544997.1 lmo0937 family membrane protein [Pseudomonadota bacterium]QVM83690.1 lmo0937 family membrane protein [Novosphingobium decolorationis]
MLKYIILILLALWLLGFVVFKVAGALIHVLLFVAIVIGLYQLFFAKRGKL